MHRTSCSSLVRFMGLRTSFRREARREAEERKEAFGVEEEGQLDDAPAVDAEHLQSPGLVALAVLARLVLPEGRRAAARRSG